jgi:hypothetical protein
MELNLKQIKVRNAERHDIWCDVTVSAAQFSVSAKLYNLSIKGCAIALDGVTVWRGRAVFLSFSGEANIHANVVWSNGPDAGLAFALEIDPKVFSAMIGCSATDEISDSRPRLFDRPSATSAFPMRTPRFLRF